MAEVLTVSVITELFTVTRKWENLPLGIEHVLSTYLTDLTLDDCNCVVCHVLEGLSYTLFDILFSLTCRIPDAHIG